jgi:transposase InsO family protein
MPWEERTVVSERLEFVTLADQEGADVSALCGRFGISRKTGYKWLARYRAAGAAGLADRPRRPVGSPGRTPADVEAAVLALRDEHPAWGGRKLHHRLVALGLPDVPAPSTITAILRRHGRLEAEEGAARRAFLRFERAAPNDLWQLDFMGDEALGDGRVHPLTVLDDHSRFAVLLAACANERQAVVVAALEAAFRRYGLPRAILSDNGSPWAPAGRPGITAIEAWLLRLGVAVTHGRAYHPQTQGKVERFHGTIAAEVFAHRALADLDDAQRHFDRFRAAYNLERPHEALRYAVPASRYRPSPRPFPDPLPPVRYGPDDDVRVVTRHGSVSWRSRRRFVGRGLVGEPVAIRPTLREDVWVVVYCHRQVATIDLNDPDEV